MDDIIQLGGGRGHRIPQWKWVKIKPNSNVMCVNKCLTGDVTIMRQSHEVDRKKERNLKRRTFSFSWPQINLVKFPL